MSSVRVGLSGYAYKPWQGEDRFYPPELKYREFLGFYSARYPIVEMDGTWYKMPSKEVVQAWIDGAPPGFQFSFKMHRRVTHMGRMKPECYESVHFLCKRLGPLAATGAVGPFLVQLPPNLKKDCPRLEAFLAILPETFDNVEEYTGPKGIRARWAFEFRNDTWNCDEVAELLRARNAAWVASDTDDVPAVRRDTADFTYTRLRRTEFEPAQLEEWSRFFNQTAVSGKECFVYCKHEDEGSPWQWADYLIEHSPKP